MHWLGTMGRWTNKENTKWVLSKKAWLNCSAFQLTRMVHNAKLLYGVITFLAIVGQDYNNLHVGKSKIYFKGSKKLEKEKRDNTSWVPWVMDVWIALRKASVRSPGTSCLRSSEIKQVHMHGLARVLLISQIHLHIGRVKFHAQALAYSADSTRKCIGSISGVSVTTGIKQVKGPHWKTRYDCFAPHFSGPVSFSSRDSYLDPHQQEHVSSSSRAKKHTRYTLSLFMRIDCGGSTLALTFSSLSLNYTWKEGHII